MRVRTVWMRVVGIALLSLLVVAMAQPATQSDAFVVTSSDEILGTRNVSESYLRFDADGSLRQAGSEAELDSAPYAVSASSVEDAVMVLTELEVSGVPSCGDAVGRYEVQLFKDGTLEIAPIDDACVARAQDITLRYESTEAFTLVGSAEPVLGTWRCASTYTRFDEDGTVRSAWSADTLESDPYVVSDYRFDGLVMHVMEVDGCSGPTGFASMVGPYHVSLFENGELMILRIEDPCSARVGAMQRLYERVQ